MITASFSPRSMKNSIWERPDIKAKKNRWEFNGRRNPQRKADITIIRFAKPHAEGYHFMGSTLKTWDEVKAHAASNGVHEVRMGAIKAKISLSK